MIPIAKLKGDMEFYKSLGSLVEVLKLIAAAQYQTLEKKIQVYAVYLNALNNVMQWLDVQQVNHPFVSRSEAPTGILAVTTDAGLLGGLNSLVIDKALKTAQEENGKLIIVGKRGQLYVEQREGVHASFPGVNDAQRLPQALQVRDYLIKQVLAKKLGTIIAVFPRALSFTMQRIEVMQLLPFIPEIGDDGGISNVERDHIIVESECAALIEYVIYLWMGQKIFEIFGMSRLAEQAARYSHLEKCTDRVKELDKKLRYQYFRVRHEVIDQNMRELFSARLLHGQ